MSLNQMNEDLNDAFETYFHPKQGHLKNLIYRVLNSLISNSLKLRTKLLNGRVLVNERIVEYPQILRWIRPEGVVLDIGCVTSRLPIQLASLGYKVHGVDTRIYPYTHPNFEFHKADIFEWSPQQHFDIILLISTLEHTGLGSYGDLTLPEADKEAVTRISKWLSHDGQFLVTVPFGKPEIVKHQRIYDLERLQYLFSDFEWVAQKYFRRLEGAWLPSSAEELRDIASPGFPGNGVAMLNLRHMKKSG